MDGNDELRHHTINGFYDLILNETKDGYVFAEEMAVGEPVDVTSEFAGNEIRIARMRNL